MPTVLGDYGLIGSACCRALSMADFQVVGLGRSRHGGRTEPEMDFFGVSLRSMQPHGKRYLTMWTSS